MIKSFETSEKPERVVLAGVFKQNADDAETALAELAELARTAGAETVGFLAQNRETPHPAAYFGKGKLDELKFLADETNADAVITDDELSPSQQKHMENVLKIKVLDRTALILDIFASRAKSAEGKVQVELAQHKYILGRLAGSASYLSRLGGGIGTRGPGEKKLETDRRHIRRRIADLNAELREIRATRAIMRTRRERADIPVVSLVGYTNAGKSTLLNALSQAGVLAEDKLFATLDTTTRNIRLPNGGEILLTDTVGFIKKLPAQLVSAFRATLEELAFADVLVHVADASANELESQMSVVYETIRKIGAEKVPVVTAFNKIDRLNEDAKQPPFDKNARQSVKISALTGDGLADLADALEDVLKDARREITVLIPYSNGKLLSFAHETCGILSENFAENGTELTLFAGLEARNRLREYEI